MKKIVVIEDDKTLRRALAGLLEENGYQVFCVEDFLHAEEGIKEAEPDLVLLDIILPGTNGQEILRNLRKTSDLPVIMLTSKTGETDEILSMSYGADDYMTKPFDTKELLARITVQLRRAEQHGQSGVLSVGDLALDTETFSLTVQGQAVKLTRTEYAILKLLMENPRQVIAKSVLLDRISMDTPDCTQRSLKQHISNLRKKLQAVSGGDPIETVWGIGFRLTEQKS